MCDKHVHARLPVNIKVPIKKNIISKELITPFSLLLNGK